MMSYSRSDDYFSFMAEKQPGLPAQQIQADDAAARDAFTRTDVVEYIEEPTIEVTESFVSDTTIQRIFSQFRAGQPVTVED
jgi:hypothetical protein